MRQFYIYIMASKSRVLYTGITNNLQRRVWDHKHDELPGFTRKYRIHRLVYYETFKYVGNAIAREKHIKGWRRAKKVALIESVIPLGKTSVNIGVRKYNCSTRKACHPQTKSRSFASLRMTTVVEIVMCA
jgi:putative endonuclease